MEIQLAVEANFATSVMVRTTMFDMLSAMAEIRKGLLDEHNAEIPEEDLGVVLSQESLSDQEDRRRGKKKKKRKKKKKKGRTCKKTLGSPDVGPLETPADVPILWVSKAYYEGGVGSYA